MFFLLLISNGSELLYDALKNYVLDGDVIIPCQINQILESKVILMIKMFQ